MGYRHDADHAQSDLQRPSPKYKDINFIWSHGGGALTAFAERFLVQMVKGTALQGQVHARNVQAQLNPFYYDTAQVSPPGTLACARQVYAGLADRLRHGFPISYRRSIIPGA